MPLASSKPNLISQRPVITLKSPSLKMDDTSEGSARLMENPQTHVFTLNLQKHCLKSATDIQPLPPTQHYGVFLLKRGQIQNALMQNMFAVKMGFVSREW